MSSIYTKPFTSQITFTQGWGGQFYPQSILSSFAYDIPQQLLYTVYPQKQYDIWLNVPTSLAQQLSLSGKQYNSNLGFPNPDQIYTQQIFNQNAITVAAISTNTNIQIIDNNGNNLVTDQNIVFGTYPPQGAAHYPRCVLCENGQPIVTDTGSYLVN